MPIQVRLRENLKATPPKAAAYKRYLEKLDKQKVELEKLQAKRDQLQAREHDQQSAFEAYLANLNVEQDHGAAIGEKGGSPSPNPSALRPRGRSPSHRQVLL